MFSSNTSQVSNDAVFVEDIFSTTLYTGNGSTTTINNGIDVSGEGGLVWVKARGNGNRSHTLFDSATYTTGQYYLATNITNGFLDTGVAGTFALNNNGFSVAGTSAQWNASGELFASWTFRKTPKFFDVVTYTGNGASVQNISHSLGSTPGCVIIKATSTTQNWCVFHRGTGSGNAWTALSLNSTSDGSQGTPQSTVTSTTFDPANIWGAGSSPAAANTNGVTYVAYLFAHNAGGFGLTGTDNVITCGSYAGTGNTSLNVNLGYEPQWVMIKNSTTNASSTGWYIQDNMRGMTASTSDNGVLYANLSSAEAQKGSHIVPTATGFTCSASDADFNDSGTTYIYIAIRRGPMKVPTSGTSVFMPAVNVGDGTAKTQSVGFAPDLVVAQNRGGSGAWWMDRLRSFTNSSSRLLLSNSTTAESAVTSANSGVMLDGNTTGLVQYTTGSANLNQNSYSYADWFFQRAPSFFDEVCYTGTGVDGATFSHNLTVAPELMIVKLRSAGTNNWFVYSAALGATKALYLNTASAAATSPGFWNDTAPTSSVFSTYSAFTNQSSQTYVAYLFATAVGVSKVGSFTGNGSSQTINCGFTAGSRFVMIKRTDSTGDWYVWDSARGIVSGNDPYLLMNSSAAEVTSTDYIDTYSAGFEISSTAPAAINASGGTFIFLAIA